MGIICSTVLVTLAVIKLPSGTNQPLRLPAVSSDDSGQTIWNIAHRSHESECIKNSLPAFISAYLVGADFVELDLRLTKDNVPIVYHNQTLDNNLDCQSKQKQNISEMTYEEIQKHCAYTPSHKKCDISNWVSQFKGDRDIEDLINKNMNRILSFKDLLAILRKTEIGLFIELKDYMTYPVLDELKKLDDQHHCLHKTDGSSETFDCFRKIKIISFSPNILRDNQRLIATKYHDSALRNIEIYPLHGYPDSLLASKSLWNFDGIAFHYQMDQSPHTFTQLVDELKQANPDKKIIIWDIKNAKDMVKLQSVPQLDGIINSVPEAGDLK